MGCNTEPIHWPLWAHVAATFGTLSWRRRFWAATEKYFANSEARGFDAKIIRKYRAVVDPSSSIAASPRIAVALTAIPQGKLNWARVLSFAHSKMSSSSSGATHFGPISVQN